MAERDTKEAVRVVGRYALHEAIASGGMATVHFGRLLGPVGFSRTVAIKRLHAQFASDPEFVSMFLDEARLAARIRHPNVIPTLDVVATSGELFLVMEYVPGESLARLAKIARERGTAIPLRIISAILSGMLHGLHAAHEAKSERGEPLGIVHRDVSPQNVLVGTDGVARVLDFGVAKAAGRMQTTREGQIKGKLSYMSPEQLRGKPVNRQCDIYAAGVLLWELLVGERLFVADNEGALLAKVLEGKVDPPSTRLNPHLLAQLTNVQMQSIRTLDSVVARAVATSTEERYDSAREMAIAIERALPPAMASEISEWIESTYKDVLTQRAELVAEIESSTSSVRIDANSSMRSQVAAVLDAPADPGQMVSNKADDAPRPPFDQASSKSQLSSISVASATQFPGSNRRSPVMIGIVVAAISTLVIVVAIVLTRPSGETAAKKQPTSSSISLAADQPPPSVPIDVNAHAAGAATVTASANTPVPTTSATNTASPLTDTAATSSASTSNIARTGRSVPHPPPTTASPTATPPAAPAQTAAGSKSDCNPPFTWDAQGLKHIKPNCL